MGRVMSCGVCLSRALKQVSIRMLNSYLAEPDLVDRGRMALQDITKVCPD